MYREELLPIQILQSAHQKGFSRIGVHSAAVGDGYFVKFLSGHLRFHQPGFQGRGRRKGIYPFASAPGQTGGAGCIHRHIAALLRKSPWPVRCC